MSFVIWLFLVCGARASGLDLVWVQAFAPVIWFHPEEKVFPMDPTQFQRSQLSFQKEDAPLLWREGDRELLKDLPNNAKKHLIEYWHFLPYSDAEFFGLGDHVGDWEGSAFLVEESPWKLKAVYTASHEGGSWHCIPSSMQTARPELFSARGSHATYFSEGKFWKWIGWDRTEKGQRWNAFKNLKPLKLESYYGFKDRWGTTPFWRMTASPFMPSDQKRLPRGDAHQIAAELKKLGCS